MFTRPVGSSAAVVVEYVVWADKAEELRRREEAAQLVRAGTAQDELGWGMGRQKNAGERSDLYSLKTHAQIPLLVS